MKRIISIALAAMMLVSCLAVTANAADKQSVKVRIEGITKTLFNGAVDVELTDETTVKDVLTVLNTENSDVTITGIDDNYITDINGDKAGSFGGYDGWYYQVNDKAAEVGINGYKVTADDGIVLYYGAFPCQVPVADLSKAKEGTISFTSYDASYDENWNATYAWTPVTDASVTIGTKKFTTDKDGVVTFNPADFSGVVNVQIDKKDASGAPAVCRLSSDNTIDFGTSTTDNKPTTTVKSSNTLTVKVTNQTAKAKTLKSKKVTYKKAVKISKAKGTVTAKITKATKNGKKFSVKKFSITKKGVLTIKKGVKKGNYKITVQVTAKGNSQFKSKTVKKTVTVKVK